MMAAGADTEDSRLRRAPRRRCSPKGTGYRRGCNCMPQRRTPPAPTMFSGSSPTRTAARAGHYKSSPRRPSRRRRRSREEGRRAHHSRPRSPRPRASPGPTRVWRRRRYGCSCASRPRVPGPIHAWTHRPFGISCRAGYRRRFASPSSFPSLPWMPASLAWDSPEAIARLGAAAPRVRSSSTTGRDVRPGTTRTTPVTRNAALRPWRQASSRSWLQRTRDTGSLPTHDAVNPPGYRFGGAAPCRTGEFGSPGSNKQLRLELPQLRRLPRGLPGEPTTPQEGTVDNARAPHRDLRPPCISVAPIGRPSHSRRAPSPSGRKAVCISLRPKRRPSVESR